MFKFQKNKLFDFNCLIEKNKLFDFNCLIEKNKLFVYIRFIICLLN